MKIAYDQATDSLYIHLVDRASVDSDEVREGIVADYDASGALVGIDVQHASKNVDIHNLSLSNLPLGSWKQVEREHPIAQTARAKPRVIPTGRKLQEALEESAEQARRLAKAFGKTIPTDQSARSRQSARA